MNKKIYSLLIVLLICINNLFSSDLIVFKDGNVIYGDIISYEENETITIKKNDNSVTTYYLPFILSIKTNVDLDNVIKEDQTTTYNLIKFQPRVKLNWYNSPPLYSFRGNVYNMEYKNKNKTQLFDFFSMLDSEGLDKNTKNLIDKLMDEIDKHNKVINSSAKSLVAGSILSLIPFFFKDESTNSTTISSLANYVGIAGVSINLVTLTVMINHLGFNLDDLLIEIAESYNQNAII